MFVLTALILSAVAFVLGLYGRPRVFALGVLCLLALVGVWMYLSFGTLSQDTWEDGGGVDMGPEFVLGPVSIVGVILVLLHAIGLVIRGIAKTMMGSKR